LARGLHGVGSHDRRKLLLVTGMDHLRVDVLLRCCRVYAAPWVVWRLRNRASLIDEIAFSHVHFEGNNGSGELP
jgi:hypothetical protein